MRRRHTQTIGLSGSLALAALALLLSVPFARANDIAQKDAITLLACLDATAVPDNSDLIRKVANACIGRVSQPCMRGPEGLTTIGMSGCMKREAAGWDVLLNADWPMLVAKARNKDAKNTSYTQTVASAAQTLQTAQRAWIAWRDAECDHAYAEWDPGSMRTIAAADCWLRLTAERTIEFHLRTRGEP
ncbi:MAG: lysozyme inhibitor LprI family protein [Pseudomonadota bacterium]